MEGGAWRTRTTAFDGRAGEGCHPDPVYETHICALHGVKGRRTPIVKKIRDAIIILVIFAVWTMVFRAPSANKPLIDNSFSGLIVSAMWLLSLNEYVRGYSRNQTAFLLLTFSALFVIAVGLWDSLNDLGRRGDLLVAGGMISALIWSGIIGRRYLKLGT